MYHYTNAWTSDSHLTISLTCSISFEKCILPTPGHLMIYLGATTLITDLTLSQSQPAPFHCSFEPSDLLERESQSPLLRRGSWFVAMSEPHNQRAIFTSSVHRPGPQLSVRPVTCQLHRRQDWCLCAKLLCSAGKKTPFPPSSGVTTGS